jgi:hypothetical protein
VAETTEGNGNGYRHALDAIIEAYGIPNGGTLVVIAVPVENLVPPRKHLEDLRQFVADVRVIAGDSAAGTIVTSLDTTRRWRSNQPVKKGAYLSAWFTVPVPVGSWQVSVLVSDSANAAGSGTRFNAVPVPAFDGRTLAISDPILGREAAGLAWQHNGVAIPLNPTNAWRKDEAAILSYELDGLVTGRDYETRIELWDAKGDRQTPRNAIAFSGKATTPHAAARQELSLRELPAGDYRLVVTVKDAVTGKTVTRERSLAVRGK